MPNPQSLLTADRLFKALGDPTRLRLLNLLVAGELCVCDIMELLDLPQSTASRHLGYLRRVGLVGARRAGKFVHYRLADGSGPLDRRVAAWLRSAAEDIRGLARERARAAARIQHREEVPC